MGFDNESLDEDFPLGDGTADVAATVRCPYCGEMVEIGLDPGGGSSQEYVEDCEVCCRPWRVSVHYVGDGTAEVSVVAESEN
ncbi:MAG TPA: CPXCG motif-containing cysteine-rich protein [Gemmatimonadales bacterium]|nr:CPXCG motif-containing cysteine-rich protein [Gemmatimonadales bacterium]